MSKPGNLGAKSEERLHITVHGRVQGVGFRESMLVVALEHGVAGWVRNRMEGTVEAVFHGPPEACARLLQWSRRGPLAARVERVEVRAPNVEESQLVQRGFRRLDTR